MSLPHNEARERLTAWVDDVQLSARVGVPHYANPGELKADVRTLLAREQTERERADKAEAERDERLRVNTGLIRENTELKRKLARQPQHNEASVTTAFRELGPQKPWVEEIVDDSEAALAQERERAAPGSQNVRQGLGVTGAELIAQERERQMAAEGWTPEHDDEHIYGELAQAAASYALPPAMRESSTGPRSAFGLEIALLHVLWPWDDRWWKPSPDDRVRELVKAGALLAAEIDRLKRLVA